jgi:hypothetical protein
MKSEILNLTVALEADAMTSELAETVLAWKFSEREKERVQVLLDKNSANAMTGREKGELNTFIALSGFLEVLQAEARHILKPAADNAP